VAVVGGIVGFGFGRGVVLLNPVGGVLFIDLAVEPGERYGDICEG
jgi:hypothetical protein